MTAPPIILIVDDVAANRDTLRQLLVESDYDFREAADGITALNLGALDPPDLVLLDVMMPGMDGYEVCRRMRADPRLAEVPIIMVTALDDQTSRLTGIEAGADDFITKPYHRAELRARVQTITRLNRYRRLGEAQSALRESEARFRNLADQCDEAFRFATLNPERVVYVSPALETIWGLPGARFLADARLWEKSIHPDDRSRVHQAYEAVLAHHTDRFAEEYRVVRPDGTVRWVIDSGTPIRGTNGVVVSIGGVTRDITDRKAAEEVLLRAQRMENIGMLAAGIAHDFNNALAPLVIGCTILRQHVAESPAGLHLLDLMATSAGRSVALVSQLMSFARGASGQRQLLQTSHVLRELAELSEVTFPKNVHLTTVLPPGLWPVMASPTQIHQIFLNLCVNARDAMPQGGQLTFTAANRTLDDATAAEIPGARPGNFLAVEVKDTGTGIPPETLLRIWEPFFTTKGEGKGTGLGLSTVSGILNQYDGFAEIVTSPAGTAFTIYLPAATSTAGAEATLPSALPARGAGELILIVDDEKSLCLFAAQSLRDHGYRTIVAGDGVEAIAVFAPRASEVHLVLTDLDMPKLGGAALATALRQLRPGLPMIAMTGTGEDRNDSTVKFATAVLTKPFQTNTLLQIVRHTLDAAGPPGH